MSSLSDWIKALFIVILPARNLSRCVYWLARVRYRFIKNLLIRMFIRYYQVDMTQAVSALIDDYPSFNSFFTRELKPGMRQWHINAQIVLSPVDGTVSEIGVIQNNKLIQAKGMDYSINALLASDTHSVEKLIDGSFTTLYLSPRDYHRIHMPTSGRLIRSIYVPGRLFPVGSIGVNTIKRLFARNERFISVFETDVGLMVLVMVGAIFVGSIETVWLGEITPAKHRVLTQKNYSRDKILLHQGDELGRFNMGSTVILMFEKNKIAWLHDLQPAKPIQTGQKLAATL